MYKINEEKAISDWEIERKPSVSISWNDEVDSSPVQDLRTWQMLLGYQYSIYGNCIKFNSYIVNFIVNNKEFINYGGKAIGDLTMLLWGSNSKESTLASQSTIYKIDNSLSYNIVLVEIINDPNILATIPYKPVEAIVM